SLSFAGLPGECWIPVPLPPPVLRLGHSPLRCERVESPTNREFSREPRDYIALKGPNIRSLRPFSCELPLWDRRAKCRTSRCGGVLLFPVSKGEHELNRFSEAYAE